MLAVCFSMHLVDCHAKKIMAHIVGDTGSPHQAQLVAGVAVVVVGWLLGSQHTQEVVGWRIQDT